MGYAGPDRRRDGDHDTITELVQIMISHQKEFAAHVVNDETNFKDISTSLKQLSKYVYMGMGIIIALNAIPIIAAIVKLFKGV